MVVKTIEQLTGKEVAQYFGSGKSNIVFDAQSYFRPIYIKSLEINKTVGSAIERTKNPANWAVSQSILGELYTTEGSESTPKDTIYYTPTRKLLIAFLGKINRLGEIENIDGLREIFTGKHMSDEALEIMRTTYNQTPYPKEISEIVEAILGNTAPSS